jgi:hypothetical protein
MQIGGIYHATARCVNLPKDVWDKLARAMVKAAMQQFTLQPAMKEGFLPGGRWIAESVLLR